MNPKSEIAQTSRQKTTATPSRAAAKAKPVTAPSKPAQTALAKKMPDYFLPATKRTLIIAHVNVGWGNTIYMRGDGGGLSWDVGAPMVCLADDQWVWSYPENQAPREFKFLRNDQDWALGENHVVSREEILGFAPQFPPLSGPAV